MSADKTKEWWICIPLLFLLIALPFSCKKDEGGGDEGGGDPASSGGVVSGGTPDGGNDDATDDAGDDGADGADGGSSDGTDDGGDTGSDDGADPCDPDTTDPTEPTDLTIDSSASETSAGDFSWTASTDTCGLSAYEIAIGTTANGNDVQDWLDIGDVTSYTLTDGVDGASFTLNPGEDYFVSVRAVDSSTNTSSDLSTGAFSYFDPRAIAGLQVWLDGTDYLGDGTPFTDNDLFAANWADKSGSGNDYILTSGPVYREAAINGVAAVEITSGGFDGPPGAAMDADGDWTIYYVAQRLASDDNGRLVDAQVGNYLLGYHDVHRRSVYLNNNPSEYNSGVATTDGNLDPHFFGLTRAASGDLNMYDEDGHVKLWTGTDSAAGIIWDILMGAYSGGSQRSHAMVGEFIIFDNEISASDRADLEAYLAAKWGI